MREFVCDLHIHTRISPCATLDMSPGAIVQEAIGKGIDIIAITDHNAIDNVSYVMKCAEGITLTILVGMEVTTVKKVHVVAIFSDIENAIVFQSLFYKNLPGVNDEDDLVVRQLLMKMMKWKDLMSGY